MYLICLQFFLRWMFKIYFSKKLILIIDAQWVIYLKTIRCYWFVLKKEYVREIIHTYRRNLTIESCSALYFISQNFSIALISTFYTTLTDWMNNHQASQYILLDSVGIIASTVFLVIFKDEEKALWALTFTYGFFIGMYSTGTSILNKSKLSIYFLSLSSRN